MRALLLVMACLCPAASAADPPAPSWFVPPPAKPGIAGAGRGVDMRRASETDITVTAQRRPVQRDPHGEETHDFQPAHSEAASPAQGKIGQSLLRFGLSDDRRPAGNGHGRGQHGRRPLLNNGRRLSHQAAAKFSMPCRLAADRAAGLLGSRIM